MRLTPEQVKQGILHPERIVRDAAVRYFSDSFSDDPTVMPLAIQALETYGWDDAFEYHFPLVQLAQTEETLLWLIDRLNKAGRPASQDQLTLCDELAAAIAHADVALLMKHEQAILGLEGMQGNYRDVLADRLRLMTADTDACWQELQGLCEQHKESEYIDRFPIDQANRLCEAIARDGACADRVHALLTQPIEDYDNNPMGWMECFAVRLAGEMRLDAAVPILAGKLREDGGDLMNDECQRAFVRVGTDATVEAICRDFAAAPWHYKLYASSALEHIHSDLAVAKALELFAQEKDGDIRGNLLRAVLGNFSTDGIEPARLFPRQPGENLHGSIVAVATLAGVSFLELDEWMAEEKEAAATRKLRQEAFFSAPPEAEPLPPMVQDLVDPAPVAPITRGPKVGRNDPCPCGSGKKYKKCCLDKE